MKAFKLGLVVMAAALITLAWGAPAMAFHSGGVAGCSGCHTMHNSQDGAVISATPGVRLLKDSDPTATCLMCHAAYGQLTDDGSSRGSGGDFYWLSQTYSWSAHGHAASSPGDSHGHNVVSETLSLTVDATLTTAPGGTYASADLSCGSCHDPHGTGEGVLLLWGTEKPGWSNAAPVLKGLSRRTMQGSSGAVANDNHIAYGSGMSAWCANCHTDFEDGDVMHVTDHNMGSTIAGNYNRYISTRNLTGNSATAYWEAVPFETGATQEELELDPLANSSEAGPTTSSKVMCLSCHRAHASPFQDAGRWDFTAQNIVVDSHPTVADVPNAYYGVEYVGGEHGDPDAQTSLCSKCHIKDQFFAGS